MPDNDIRVKISAVDKASAIVDAFRKKLEGTEAPANRAAKALRGWGQGSSAIDRFSKGGAVPAITDHFDKLSKTSFQAFQNIGRLSGELGGLTSLATGGGLIAGLTAAAALTKNWADQGMGLANVGANIGIAATQLERYRRVAAAAGVSPESATSALGALSQDVFGARSGLNPGMMATFGALGVNLSGPDGKPLAFDDIVKQMAAKLSGISSPAGQVAAAGQFGIGADALPMFRKGPDWISQQLGAVGSQPGFGDNAYDGSQKLFEDFTKLDTAAIGLKNTLAQNFTPAVDDAVRGLTGMTTFLAQWAGNSPAGTYSGMSWPWNVLSSAGLGLTNTIMGTHYGTGGAANTSMAPAPTGTKLDRAKQAMSYFMSQGWTAEQAAGIVGGGIQGESNFNPQASNAGHLNIAQWDETRRQKILAGTGIDIATADYSTALRAMQWELTNNESGAGNALKGAKTAAEAADIIRNQYERPDTAKTRDWNDVAQREAYANSAMALAADVNLPAAGGAGGGTVTVDINHNNAPDGSSLDAAAIGAATIGALKITKAMPSSGGAQ